MHCRIEGAKGLWTRYQMKGTDTMLMKKIKTCIFVFRWTDEFHLNVTPPPTPQNHSKLFFDWDIVSVQNTSIAVQLYFIFFYNSLFENSSQLTITHRCTTVNNHTSMHYTYTSFWVQKNSNIYIYMPSNKLEQLIFQQTVKKQFKNKHSKDRTSFVAYWRSATNSRVLVMHLQP